MLRGSGFLATMYVEQEPLPLTSPVKLSKSRHISHIPREGHACQLDFALSVVLFLTAEVSANLRYCVTSHLRALEPLPLSPAARRARGGALPAPALSAAVQRRVARLAEEGALATPDVRVTFTAWGNHVRASPMSCTYPLVPNQLQAARHMPSLDASWKSDLL